MRISVCMGIYNGEKYIVQQLESIRKQTRVPDEVILCDDGSADGTQKCVREYLESHGELSGWKLICNEENKGYPGNFYSVMEQCTGDIVFLADQDDVWEPEKIARMSDRMERQEEVKVLACTFGLIDGQNEAIHTVMSPTDKKRNGSIHSVSIQQVFYKCEWPGMVLAYRNAWYRNIMKKNAVSGVPAAKCGKIPHDFLLCAWAAEEQGFYQLEEVLAYHRRHENNTGGEEHRMKKLLNKQRKLNEIENYNRILDEFAMGNVMQSEKGRNALAEKRNSMQGRYEALESGRIGEVLKNAWKYKAQVRIATLVCDVLIVRQKEQTKETNE